jgi:hypothetical protein
MPAGSPYPKPLTAPPPWLPLLEQTDQGEPESGPGPGKEGPVPGDHWPALETIDYVTKLIVLILLILGLPWLLGRVFTNPAATPEHATAFAGGAVPKAA